MRHSTFRFVMMLLLGMNFSLGCWAEVWESPKQINKDIRHIQNSILQVEFKTDETILHIHTNFRPHRWIKYGQSEYLETNDGKKYNIKSGEPSSDHEKRIELDSLFWMDDSGQVSYALHFEPLPSGTKEFHFPTNNLWYICPQDYYYPLPIEWQPSAYTQDEQLPDVKVQKGMATIKAKVLNYHPDMKLELSIYNFQDLASDRRRSYSFPVADDGTISAEVPLSIPNTIYMGIDGLIFSQCVIAPDKVTELYFNPYAQLNERLTFKGYLARTNQGLERCPYRKWDYDDSTKDELWQRLQLCKNGQERVTFLQKFKDEQIEKINANQGLTSAAKALIRMSHESQCVYWIKNFGLYYSLELMRRDVSKRDLSDDEEKKLRQECNEMLRDYTSDPNDLFRDYELLNAPYAPISEEYSGTCRIEGNHAPELFQSLACVIDALRLQEPIDVESVQDSACKAIIKGYYEEQERIRHSLALQSNVSLNKLDTVAAERILGTILGHYSGKTVLIDMWETWCGPCRRGHELLAPFKEKMKDQPVVFVYLVSPSSPLKGWQDMIANIPGDHYYLTKEQYAFIQSEIFKSTGVPTYGVFDPLGYKTHQQVGVGSFDRLQEEVTKAMNKK